MLESQWKGLFPKKPIYTTLNVVVKNVIRLSLKSYLKNLVPSPRSLSKLQKNMSQ